MDTSALDTTTRLDLAATRDFTRPGAGRERRRRLTEHSRRWLSEVWDTGAREVLGAREEGVALAAVGSLARGDSGPLSDVDLVLLHDGRSIRGEDVTALAERIWYPVWDSGARLDHSVRTLGECRQVAAQDLSAAVGLLDLEWIAGDPVVVSGVRQSIAHDWRSNARKRLPELVETMRQRHERHGDLTTSIEPDLKEARGGLRDMTLLRALTAAWLADRPHGEVDAAYDRLLDVRDALHVVTGRGRDRLGREDQDAVAALLGHPDADAMLTGVVSSARAVSFALDSTMRRSSQSQRARTLRVGPRRPVLIPLGYGLFEHDGEVVLGRGLIPSGEPLLLLRAAAAAARRELPLGPTTVANLTRDVGPLPTPWPDAVRDAFLDLLASGPGLVQVWEALDMSGVIGRWIPEWKAVRSRPQRNAVHRYTVDRHLVETVVEAAARRREVDRADLLLVTALLHDIGKIAGVHDHAVEGAPVAATIAARMGFSAEDVDAVELLVREHLSLIDLATRRDPQDPQTVRALVATVEERADLLEHLRTLTEADALAAGPTAWTSWRARLVQELTARAREMLSGRRVVPAEPSDASEVLTPVALENLLVGDPYVTVSVIDGGARVDVADRDRLGLFADTAGLLAAYGAVVRSARLRTHDGLAADTWYVEVPDGDLPSPEAFARGLRQLSTGDRGPLRSLERRGSGVQRRPGEAGARATVVPDASDDATVLEVRAADRPGLLRDIGMTFARFGLGVRSAHVATYAGQTLDTFYVTGAGDRPVAPPMVAQLIGALMDACDAVVSG
ncbi:[protein-PII] uridylyltransferase [Luteipulveratus sp. YIM 133132]|uniref:[protein-PII] uridylyltransferase n=1 Tax=Luteipulveratus flavus TaxID=3031728 RepID=UPI0023AEDF31|nr:[protein-PII] uridylyltransferase [Luteipulveratus sp. YIM 133132]MDE9367875.1 [protein-PII] uridylyltransferase [Luteipulveratus sp. YIM 133132]